jgi:hypothetical protein
MVASRGLGLQIVIQLRPLTHKMQSFVVHVAGGMKQADAYRASFHTANMKAKTVRDEASRLAQNPGVAAAMASEKAEIRRRNHIAALKKEDRILACVWALVENDHVAPSDRVKALQLAAQLCGMFNQPPEAPKLSASNLEDELRERLALFSQRGLTLVSA